MTRPARLPRLLVRLFPASTRSRIGQELEGDLASQLAVSTHPQALRESAGALSAAMSAWHSHLRAPNSIRAGIAGGVAMWFALLLGLGPGRRLVAHMASSHVLAGRADSNPLLAVAALTSLAVLYAATRVPARHRILFIATGCAFAAGSNRYDFEGFGVLFLYELRWLVPMTLAAGLAARIAPVQGWLLAASFAIGAVGGLDGPWAGRNYAIALEQLSPGTPLGDELTFVAIAGVFMLGPLLWPALFVRLLPAAIHLGAVGLIASIRQGYVSGPHGLTVLGLAVWLSIAASIPFLIERRKDHSDATP